MEKLARTINSSKSLFLITALAGLLVMTACGDEADSVVSSNAALAGDLTGDGKVNVVDMQCMILTQSWVQAGKQGLAPKCLADKTGADLNCDGKVNVLDYQIMADVVMGKPLHAALDKNGDGVVDTCQAALAPVYGDLTGDGKVNVVDLQCMILTQRHAQAGKTGAAPTCLKTTADLNCNGKVNVVDYQLMIKLVSGQGLPSALDADSDGTHDACQAAPAAAPVYGDLTGDGKVNVVDLQCMILTQRWAQAGKTGAAPTCLKTTADLNCNGKFNVVDYQLMIKMVNGQGLPAALDKNSDGTHDACQQ